MVFISMHANNGPLKVDDNRANRHAGLIQMEITVGESTVCIYLKRNQARELSHWLATQADEL